jgi:dolichyl-phosphate beta-glucosyltransferase
MSHIELSLVIPVYNERERIADGLRRIFAYVDAGARPTEVVIVDDGSRDGTADLAAAEIAGRREARLIRLPANRGKGFAVKTGMLAATGAVRLFTDIDLSVSIETADPFCEMCREADAVIGTRKTAVSQVTVRQPRRREMLGEVFRQFTLRFLTPGLTDITCGFKAFRAAAAERIFAASRIDRWSFDAEILFLALRWGLTVREIPVEWRNSPASKVRLWVDLPRSAVDLLRIRAAWLLGRYREA